MVPDDGMIMELAVLVRYKVQFFRCLFGSVALFPLRRSAHCVWVAGYGRMPEADSGGERDCGAGREEDGARAQDDAGGESFLSGELGRLELQNHESCVELHKRLKLLRLILSS
ncbi:hypothetical protein KFK09_001161 [Dendrobium nobile]|uniref:Uncharacterized protein n=1 Tax=Dendrobium nobile TaxID=94219 RepID=A0A8T3C8V6_DENNO|nr:hypothetical protein KFK09_001161 [Dendrobium nobile]